jgi:hypothetical protein
MLCDAYFDHPLGFGALFKQTLRACQDIEFTTLDIHDNQTTPAGKAFTQKGVQGEDRH